MRILIKDTKERNVILAFYANNNYEEENPSVIEERKIKIKGFEVVSMSDKEARAMHMLIDDNGEYLVIYESNCKKWFRNSYVSLFEIPKRG